MVLFLKYLESQTFKKSIPTGNSFLGGGGMREEKKTTQPLQVTHTNPREVENFSVKTNFFCFLVLRVF